MNSFTQAQILVVFADTAFQFVKAQYQLPVALGPLA